MLSEFVTKLLSLNKPNKIEHEGLSYVDKNLHVLCPPVTPEVEISTLQGLVDLYDENLDGVSLEGNAGEILFHVTSPTTVELIDRESDQYGVRRCYARATYPEGCTTFPFGQWLNPENFVIMAQAGFQRVLIEKGDVDLLAQDLDYVVKIASGISTEQVQTSSDDGISQTVAMRAGVALKTTDTLKSQVNLAPYRTFPEIDQVLSGFVFRARTQNGIQLALFEGDGGRWRIAATAAIAAWLRDKLSDVNVPVIS